MTDHEGQESMAGTRRPIIEVKNLRKEYPVLDETVVALERINLTIPQGRSAVSTANPVLANPLC